MPSIVTFGVVSMLIGMVAAMGYALHRMLLTARVEERLTEQVDKEKEAQKAHEVPKPRKAIRWTLAAPWVLAFVSFFVISWATNLSTILTVAMVIVVLMISAMTESWWYEQQLIKLEMALADAVDLMVSSLHAGASVLVAVDRAADEASPRLQSLLEEMVARIRFGDDPHVVFESVTARVPLESFRLFTLSLGVHWEVGGSLAPVLASIGRTIRDRIEIARRTRAMTTQARVSIITVLAVTYLIGLGMYQMNPERVSKFISSDIGQYVIAGSLVLQAIGALWISRLAKPKF